MPYDLPPRPSFTFVRSNKRPPHNRSSTSEPRNKEDHDLNEGVSRHRALPPTIGTQSPSHPRHGIPKRPSGGDAPGHQRAFPFRGSNSIPLGSRQRPSSTSGPRSAGNPYQHLGLRKPSNEAHAHYAPPIDMGGIVASLTRSIDEEAVETAVAVDHTSTPSPEPPAPPTKKVRIGSDSGGDEKPCFAGDMSVEVKAEDLDDVPLSPAAPPRSEGTTFYKMRDDCVMGAPGYLQAREKWRALVREYLSLQGKIVVRTLIRADGMAVDWISASDVDQISQQRKLASGSLEADSTMFCDKEDIDRGVRPSTYPEGSIRNERHPLDHDVPADNNLVIVHSADTQLSTCVPGVPTSTEAKPSSSSIEDDIAHPGRYFVPTALAGPSRQSIAVVGPSTQQRLSNRKGTSPVASVVPPVMGIYDNPQTVANSFLMQFLRLFDANRLALHAAYHPDALFSYQCWSWRGKTNERCDKHTEDFGPTASRRNLSKATSSQQHLNSTTLLKCGPRSIVAQFKLFQKWTHGALGPSSGTGTIRRFVWDVSLLPNSVFASAPSSSKKRGRKDNPKSLLVVCHGDLFNPENPDQAVSFDRSFILRENNNEATRDYWPYAILSDQLTIRDYSTKPPWDENTELNQLVV
ncbi:hypothetical protein FRB99_005042 [Tulasnella sp. 403]|nr:hypothetical protein FRB99_005042 [Tulasnella sp. 403]